MMNDQEVELYLGIDWGSRTHHVCLLNRKGALLNERSFSHDGAGFAEMIQWLGDYADADLQRIAVAIEVPHGPVVECLLAAGCSVHSVNPKQLDRFRDRFSPSGCKDDRRDALVLAHSLRTDARCFRALQAADPAVVRLRACSRLREELVAERTRLVNRIRQNLWHYYPQFNQLIGNGLLSWHVELWQRAPTPEAAARVQLRTLAALLKLHRIRRFDAAEVKRILAARPLPVAAVAAEVGAECVATLMERLKLADRQIAEAEQRLQRLIAEFADPAPDVDVDSRRADDVSVLSSIPGVGLNVLSVLLGEAHDLLARRDYATLRCLGGVAPVTRQSGKAWAVQRRRASNRRLNDALYHWARIAIQHDARSRSKYAACRERGHSHGRALRTVADRLLHVACAMLRRSALYNPQMGQPVSSA